MDLSSGGLITGGAHDRDFTVYPQTSDVSTATPTHDVTNKIDMLEEVDRPG